MSNQNVIYDPRVQTTFSTIWLTNEFIRKINVHYLPFRAVLVCTNLIALLWNMLKQPKVRLSSRCVHQAKGSSVLKMGVQLRETGTLLSWLL